MKFSCNSRDLKSAVAVISRVVNKKDAVPVTAGILIEASEENKVKLTGYDFEVGMVTEIGAEVYESGSIVLNADWLNKELKKLKTAMIDIEASSSEAKITYTDGKGGEAEISGIEADEFPEMPKVEEGLMCEIDKYELYDMINQTIFAIAQADNARPAHRGAKIELSKNAIKMIGVDGYRLAIRKGEIEYEGEDTEFIIPRKALAEVVNLVDKVEGKTGDEEEESKITVSIGKKHGMFEYCGYAIISRLLEGEFMDYKTAIPTECKVEAEVNTEELKASIERIIPMVDDNTRTPVRCKISKDEIEVSTASSIGHGIDGIDAKVEIDEEMTIGFNAQFMLDALNCAEEDMIKLELNTPVAPIVIKPESDDRFLFLVLPMRLRG